MGGLSRGLTCVFMLDGEGCVVFYDYRTTYSEMIT